MRMLVVFSHVDHRWTGLAVLLQTLVRFVSVEEHQLDFPKKL